MTRSEQHHLVSAGYQRNFGTDDRRLDIVDARTGDVIKLGRAIRKNWRREHWHSVIDPTTGDADASLEESFSKVETWVLAAVRHVKAGQLTEEQSAAIVSLFAMHVARSHAFRSWTDELSERKLPGIIQAVASKSRPAELFEQQIGRPPEPGELEALAQRVSDERTKSGAWRRDGIANNHNELVDILNSRHIQIIEVDDALPGLVLGDVPIVHANLKDRRFGYRDRLAVCDADLIIGPLTRRVLACFSATPDPHVRITTKRRLNEVIALFARAAVSEVACHPEDLPNLRRVCRNKPPLRRP